MNVILTYRKRVITQEDISFIGKVIEELWSEGRTAISRFLILPWVTVPHLASHLLGRIAKSISEDWQRLYHHPIHPV